MRKQIPYFKKPDNPIPDTYADYLRKAEKKDPDTYKGYSKLVIDHHGKVKTHLFSGAWWTRKDT